MAANIDTLSIQFKANGTDKAVKNIKEMAKAVKTLGDSVNNLSAAKLRSFTSAMDTLKASTPSKGQAQRMKDFASGVKSLSNAIGNANINGFAKSMANIGTAVSGLKGQSLKGITNTLNAMQQLGQQAQQTGNQVKNALGNLPTNNQPVAPQVQTPISPQAAQAAIPALEKVQVTAKGISETLRKMGLLVPTKQFKSLEAAGEKIRKKYDEVRQSMIEAMQNGTMTQGDDSFKKKMVELDALRNKYNELIQKQRELAHEGGAFKPNENIGKAYQGIQQAVGGVKQAFGGVSSVIQNVNKYINSFVSKISKVGSASKSAKRDTAKFTDTIKRMGNEVTRVSKMLKLMITRMALRKVIEEVGNGFKSLALHSQEFDTNMSNLINASKTLGYSVAGMAGQLLNALAPVLTTLIQLITKAVNALNMLFSALRGGTTWAKAKEQTGKWSDAIKAANGNAKELKKTVLGFDELNQLNDNSSSGGGGSAITDQFEDVDIPDWAKDLAKKIKDIAKDLFDPIKKAWEKVGEFVKASWKYAMQQVWALVKDIARDFMTVWKQADTQKIFENILLTIGWIGMAVGNLAKQFREAWNYNQTGLHILENIRDIILIITNHIRNMAEATAMWAANLNFKPLLLAIEGWLQSLEPAIDAVMGILEDFYTQVVLKFTKWVIESGLPELINVFQRFNEAVDWDGLREKLAKLWEHLEPFMETVGEGLIIFIERVTTALANFVNGEEFADFLEKLEEWMDSVTPEDVADGIERLVAALVAFKVAGLAISALSAVAGIISAIATACSGLASVAGGVGTFVSAIGGLGSAILPIVGIAAAVAVAIYSLVESYGGIAGVIDKIKTTIGSIVESIKKQAENLKFKDKIDKLKESFHHLGDALGSLKSFWDIVFKLFEVSSKWIAGTLLPIIDDLVTVFGDAVDIIADAIDWLGDLSDIIVGVFTGDMDKAREGAEGLWKDVKNFFEDGVKFVTDLFIGFVDAIVSPFEGIKYALVGDPIVIDMWDEVTKVFSDAVDDVVGFVKDLKDDVIKFFTDIKEKVDEKITDIKAKFGEWSDKVKETKDNIKTSLQNLKDDASNKMDNIKQDLGTFKEDWATKWQDAKAKLDDFKTNSATTLTDIKDNVVKCFEGIKNGIKTPINGALDFVEKLVNGIIDAFNGLGDKLGSLDIDLPDWVEEKTGISDFTIGLPKLNRITIPRLANGGQLKEDGFFFANHNELVGSFGNGRTAVTNNEQILKSIENGVYNAVMSAMANSNSGASYISNEIVVDGDVIARTITKAQEKQQRRYSPQMV